MNAVPRRRAGTVPRPFYEGGAVVVAPVLLNKVLVRTGSPARAGRIVEVEAYRGEADPASHAYRGRTPRNATMFGAPGRMYVYFSYGMHYCANVVCMPDGVAEAVLLRALAPVRGVAAMRIARGAAGERDHQLTSGPAKLCQAMGITRDVDGADLVTGRGGFRIVDDGVAPPDVPGVSERIGIRVATERQWRFWVPGDPNVSGRRRVPATISLPAEVRSNDAAGAAGSPRPIRGAAGASGAPTRR